ncbi:unnamed protein product, partial [Enterobius vermicularis]|uniref:DNA-directed RNA polymerase n=1 Tax=Enterobius vermicularis TaxID=51028 RepID=A0A0N4VR72_ENTVE
MTPKDLRKETTQEREKGKPELFQIYFLGAYLVTDRQIKIPLLTDCYYLPKLFLQIEGQKAIPLKLSQLQKCEDVYDKLCTYEGKYGTADYITPIPTSMILNGTLKLYVFLKTDPGRREVLNVIDLRVVQREKKPHRLAVCT